MNKEASFFRWVHILLIIPLILIFIKATTSFTKWAMGIVILLLLILFGIGKDDYGDDSKSDCSHDWVKRGGPRNRGDGTFEQTYVCRNCKEIKVEVS